MSSFGPADLFRMSMRTLVLMPWRVLVPAVVVFGVGSTGDVVFQHLVDEHAPVWPWGVAVTVVSGLATVGVTLYSGLLDRLVGAVERGKSPPTVRDVLRSAPWVKLILADLVLLGIELMADAFLLVPGLVLFTLFAIVGPLINLQGLGIVEAFVRSFQLVRTKFWTALVMVTLPVVVEHEVLSSIELEFSRHTVLWFVVVYATAGIVAGTFAGLMEVSLAEHLVYGASGPRGLGLRDVRLAR